jgi:hypothetical protein
MQRFFGTSLFIWSLLICSSATLSAGIDTMDLQLKKQFRHPLLWQNIEGAPYLVKGPEPDYNLGNRRHEVKLNPGQSVHVKIPAYSSLCLVQTAPDSEVYSPEIYLSNGSGLWKALQPRKSADTKFLYIHPDWPKPLMCRIVWPAQVKDSSILALFVSKREVVSDIAPYRTLKSFAHLNQKIVLGKSGKQKFQRLEAEQRASFQIEGPTRITIQTRLLYPHTLPQRKQRYRILCRLDNKIMSPFEIETRPVGDQVFRLENKAIFLGQLTEHFCEIPEKRHTLSLSSSKDILIRVLHQDRPDYLVSGANAPEVLPEDLHPDNLKQLFESQFKLFSASAVQDMPDRCVPANFLKLVKGIIRDNHKPQGGLLGPMLLKSYAVQRQDALEIRKTAEQLYQRHTNYQNLLPAGKDKPTEQIYRYFISSELAPLKQKQSVVGKQHQEALINSLSSAFFTPFPNKAESLTYELPKRYAPSRLQVITYGSPSPYELRIQIGKGQFKRLVAFNEAEICIKDRKLQLPEIGLAMLAANASLPQAAFENELFVQGRVPAPIVQAKSLSLKLPAQAKSIHLYSPSSTGAFVALQYRQANTYKMTEQQFLQAVALTPRKKPLYRQLISTFKNGQKYGVNHFDQVSFEGALQKLAWNDLLNEWYPLFRILQSRAELFSAPVSPLPQSHFFKTPPIPGSSDQDTENQIQQAKKLQDRKQWLPALEIWSEVVARSQGQTQQKALFALVNALEENGEQYLAEMLLRGLYLYSFGQYPQEMSRKAFVRLEKMYRADPDNNRLNLLYACQAIRNPSCKTFESLAALFLSENLPRMAILSGFSLPPDQQPLSVLLRAALRLRWTQLFGQTVTRLEETTEQTYWQSLLAIQEREYPKALALLEKTGPKGQEMTHSLNTALDIRKQLIAEDNATRYKAILAWEDWQGNQPGPYLWQNEPWTVTSHCGGFTLYNEARDLHFQGYRAQPKQPVQIQVYGPVTLRLSCRPLHPADAESSPLNDWVTVKGQDSLRIIPLTNNRPAPGLDLIGSELRPGNAAICEFQVQAGPHELAIAPEAWDCLVRLSLKRPQYQINVLPELTRDAVAAVCNGPNPPKQLRPAGFAGSYDDQVVIFVDRHGKTAVYEKTSAFLRGQDLRPCRSSNTEHWQQLARMRKKTPFGPEHALAQKDFRAALSLYPENTPKQVSKKMTLLLYLVEQDPTLWPLVEAKAMALFSRHPKVKGLKGLLNRIAQNQSLSWREVENVYGGQGIRYIQVAPWSSFDPALRIRYALLGPKESDEEILSGSHRLVITTDNIRPEQLILKLEYADCPFLYPTPVLVTYQLDDQDIQNLTLFPENPTQSLVQAKTHSKPGQLKLYLQIGAFKSLERAKSRQRLCQNHLTQDGSGKCDLMYRDSLYKIIIGPLSSRKQGHEFKKRLGSIAKDSFLTKISHTKDLPETQHGLSLDQIDIHPEIKAGSAGHFKQELHIGIPARQHSLRIEIPKKKVNQFVRIQPVSPKHLFSPKTPVTTHTSSHEEDYYFLATEKAPLRAFIQGPTWLRIDMWQNGRILSNFRYVGQGRQHIVLGVEKGQHEALYRLYRRAKDLTKKPQPLALRERQVSFAPLDSPYFQLAGSLEYPIPNDSDQPCHGRYEDGTWSLGTRMARRRNLFEDLDESRESEQFIELFGTYRFCNPIQKWYSQTKFLTRYREFGGPTLGMSQDLNLYPRYLPYNFRLQGHVYVQNPDSDGLDYFDHSPTEWSAKVSASIFQNRHVSPKTYHRPSVSMFGRYLSLEQSGEYKSQKVDQDIYTPYKSDHKTGVKIAERLVHRPWLDTIWSADIALTSNEELNPIDPDYLRLSCKWEQLLGPLQLDAGYRTNYYFSDNDRDDATWRHFVNLGADYFCWTHNQNLLQVQLRFQKALDRDDDYNAWAGLTWHRTRNQNFQDFNPGDPEFQDMHQRKLLQKKE